MLSSEESQQNVSSEIENNKCTNINNKAIVDNEDNKQNIIKNKQNAHNITERLTARLCEGLKGGIMYKEYKNTNIEGKKASIGYSTKINECDSLNTNEHSRLNSKECTISKNQCVNSCVNGIQNKSLDISNKIKKASKYNAKYDYESTKIHKGSTQSSRRTIVQRINKYNENTLTTIILWLISFVFLLTLALQGLISTRTDLTQAGWTETDGTYYANAPMTVIGGSVDETSHTIINTEDNPVKPLFTSKDSTEYTPNSVNTDVLLELLNVVNSPSVWGTKTVSEDGVTYLSAKDFGQYGDQSTWGTDAKGNAQIVLKLLEDTATTTNNVNKASAQYWQVVYRSTSADADVITLYMVDEYTKAQFNPKTADGIYRYEGNYSQSYIRVKTVLPTYNTMKSEYSQLDQYVVAPNAIPGLWQSSAYQTSGNQNNQYYNGTASNSGATTNGDYALGTSGYGASNSYFNLENGLDGLSVSKTNPTVWQGDIVSAYDDKLWVPSAFEVLHTGYGTSNIQDTGRAFDEAELVSYVSSYTSSSATLNGTTSGEDSRTGLWELNGYDRATCSWAWLRSGFSNSDAYARAVSSNGNISVNRVYSTSGVRVALHLNLKTLSSLALASISASAEATGVTVDASVSSPERTWASTMSTYYKNMIDKNSTEDVGTAKVTYTFDTNKYKISTISLNGTSVTLSDKNQGQYYAQQGICDYAYQINSGSVDIMIRNASTDVNVVANIEGPKYYYSIQLTGNYNIDKDALLIISSSDQVFMYKLSIGSASIDITMPKLIVGRTYTIKVINAEISGTLTVDGDAVVTSRPYTFVCNVENATIKLSGITIT